MEPFRPTISKEEMVQFPFANFEGKIHVIQTMEQTRKAVSFLRTQPVLGFDTETRPSFQKGKRNKVALMQLSSEKVCFLFRINIMGIPEVLLDLLTDPNIKKIGLSLKDDFHSLNHTTKIEQVNFIDIQNYVKYFRIEENSLSKIFAIIFNKRISKSQRLSNWEADFLSEKQKRYAALDAWATREIYVKLESLNNSN